MVIVMGPASLVALSLPSSGPRMRSYHIDIRSYPFVRKFRVRFGFGFGFVSRSLFFNRRNKGGRLESLAEVRRPADFNKFAVELFSYRGGSDSYLGGHPTLIQTTSIVPKVDLVQFQRSVINGIQHDMRTKCNAR